MSEEFNLEIENPEKSFLFKEDDIEVVIQAFVGERGKLKDNIFIISLSIAASPSLDALIILGI